MVMWDKVKKTTSKTSSYDLSFSFFRILLFCYWHIYMI